jgi:hypothetical protein
MQCLDGTVDMQRQGIDRARIPAQALWAAGRGDKVVEGTSLGSGSTVGDLACVLDSTFPAGTQIPAGAIYENNTLVGFVEW